MAHRAGLHTSQIARAQSRMAIGTAKIKPRVKPRLRQDCVEDLSVGFVILAAILTVRDTLALLVRIGQPARPLRESGLAVIRSLESIVDILAAMMLVRRQAKFEATLPVRIYKPIAGRAFRQRPQNLSRWIEGLILCVFALSNSRVAMAQDAPPRTPVNMFEPEAGKGINLGSSFRLYPEMVVQGIYDTNIYNLETDKKSDVLMSLRPSFLLTSDFARHQVQLSGSADIHRYAKFTGENSEAANLRAKALLELGDWLNVQPSAAIIRGVDMRGTAGDQFFTDSPVVYNRKEAEISIWRTEYRLGVTLDGHVGRTNYENTSLGGVPIDLSDRDFSNLDGSAQFDLKVSERVRLYTKLSANKLTYRMPSSKGRGSSGYALLAGAHVQITRLVDAEAAVGYIRQNFKDPTFKALSAVDYHLAASFTPRETWKITAGVDRTVDASPLNDVPAIFRSTYHLTAQHSVSDRLILEAQGSHVSEDYRGIDRVDRRYEGALSARYRLTDNFGVIGSVGYRHQSGGPGGRSYDGAVVSLSLRVVI